MPENLKPTAEKIKQLWPSWGTEEQVRQLQRVCGGWTNVQLAHLVEQLADAGEVRFATEIVRALRRAAESHFGGQRTDAEHSQLTSTQELCDFYRRCWGRAQPQYRNMSDAEILLVLEQTECAKSRRLYGRVTPHISRVTGRLEKSCTVCGAGTMVYGATEVPQQGMNEQEYSTQARYWLCEACGATEAK